MTEVVEQPLASPGSAKYKEIKAISKVRMAFRIRSKLVQNIKMNFKSMHSNLNCEKCDMKIEESQAHTHPSKLGP